MRSTWETTRLSDTKESCGWMWSRGYITQQQQGCVRESLWAARAIKFNNSTFCGYIWVLLIKTILIIYICYIKYCGNAEICMLVVGSDELIVGDDNDASPEVAKGAGRRGEVTRMYLERKSMGQNTEVLGLWSRKPGDWRELLGAGMPGTLLGQGGDLAQITPS